MNIEEYCIEKEKAELLKNFMLDIDPISNMGGAESAIFTSYCNKKHLFNFKCHICNTEWQGSAYSYIVKELACPECNENSDPVKMKYASRKRGSIPLSEWCDDNEVQGQIIRDEWIGIDEDGNEVDIHRVSYSSTKRVLWKCKDCGHKWYATINHRTAKNFDSNCPECAKKIQSVKIREMRTSYENMLSTWCSEDKRGKQIQSEWTGICKDGKHYTMEEVAYGSHLKMLWRCEKCCYKWYATIYSRVNGSDCSRCSNRSTSYQEQYLYWSLKQIYLKTENRYKAFKDIDKNGIELDILVPDIPLAIEYSPTCWHKGKEERDNLKKETCNKHNIRLIQIIEDNYNEYEEKYTENYICIPTLRVSNRDDYLLKIVSYILSTINHSINEIDIELVKKNALDYSKKKIEYEKSLAYVHPELAKEMDNGMNNIKSTEITYSSTIKIKFICPNCEYGSNGEWIATPNRRTAKGYESGCPRCNYNWYKAETNQPQNIKSQYRNLHKVTIDKEYDLRRALNNPVIKYEGEFDF